MGNLHYIEIRRLRVVARVGVPDDELAVPQELRVSVTVSVALPFAEMADDLEKTLDYAALATGIQSLAADRPRHGHPKPSPDANGAGAFSFPDQNRSSNRFR